MDVGDLGKGYLSKLKEKKMEEKKLESEYRSLSKL